MKVKMNIQVGNQDHQEEKSVGMDLDISVNGVPVRMHYDDCNKVWAVIAPNPNRPGSTYEPVRGDFLKVIKYVTGIKKPIIPQW